MLEFFQNYGADILAIIIALGSMAAAVTQIVKAHNLNKQNRQDIQITREGIVNAFKQAKIPSELKIEISNQVDKKLTDFTNKVITIIKEKEELRDQATLMILKILDYTAASNKLSEEEKAKVEDIKKLISNEDKTVDINE